MPWLLDTPLDPGDLDTGTYGEVDIVDMRHDTRRSRIVLRLEYGNTVDGAWESGLQPVGKETSVSIAGQEYAALVSTEMSVGVEHVYGAVKRGLYNWLFNNSKIAAGTII